MRCYSCELTEEMLNLNSKAEMQKTVLCKPNAQTLTVRCSPCPALSPCFRRPYLLCHVQLVNSNVCFHKLIAPLWAPPCREVPATRAERVELSWSAKPARSRT